MKRPVSMLVGALLVAAAPLPFPGPAADGGARANEQVGGVDTSRAAGAGRRGDGPATILLVRHAEKAGPSGDVPLNEAGKARAVRLASTLRDAGVRHIFTTELMRTRETARPLAGKLGVTPEVVAATSVDALVAKLRALPAGAVALVVHHSNTLPPIVEKLGGVRVAAVEDDEYDRLLVLTRLPGGGLQVVTLRY